MLALRFSSGRASSSRFADMDEEEVEERIRERLYGQRRQVERLAPGSGDVSTRANGLGAGNDNRAARRPASETPYWGRSASTPTG
jgi:hypothetical protein